jgi:predicted helicase
MNDNNKNRTYPHIDELIKQTDVKQSTAQNTKQYDMYTRFFRWATDRLGDDGVIAFITNNSFAKKANYDGFRKIAAEQFCDIYVIDFKADARTSREILRRKGDNIFENAIKVGIANSFMVRKASSREPTQIHYASVRDYAKLEEKQAFIGGRRLSDISFDLVKPDAKYNWVGLSENDWDAFPVVASRRTRSTKIDSHARAIFETTHSAFRRTAMSGFTGWRSSTSRPKRRPRSPPTTKFLVIRRCFRTRSNGPETSSEG